MKKILLPTVVSACLAISVCATASNVAHVANGDNDGVGSLRAALEAGASFIHISGSVSSITITEPLTYHGENSLRIQGRNQTIDASGLQGNDNILSITSATDVTISKLHLIGNNFEVNKNPSTPSGGKGIFVYVPESSQGVVKLALNQITVSGVGNHGVHVSDCTLLDDCGAGSGGGGQGSSASVQVTLNRVVINDVGFGKQDADGVRVDERGGGNIYFSAQNSVFSNVGADGVELDEGGSGDVIADVRNSVFNNNGEYCALVRRVEAGPCDDDGEADVDDGFDIDEAGEGSLYASVWNSQVSNNFDEGLDFDEEDGGNIVMRVNNVTALSNADEGIKASEQGEGNLSATLQEISVANNNGRKEAVEIEEDDDGSVYVVVRDSTFVGGEDEALKVEQQGAGTGQLKIRRSKILGRDVDGISNVDAD